MSFDKFAPEIIDLILKCCWTRADACRFALTHKRAYNIYKCAEAQYIASIIDGPTVERNFIKAARKLDPNFDFDKLLLDINNKKHYLVNLHKFSKTIQVSIIVKSWDRGYYQTINDVSANIPIEYKHLKSDDFLYTNHEIKPNMLLDDFITGDINLKMDVINKYISVTTVDYLYNNFPPLYIIKSNCLIYYKVSDYLYLVYDKNKICIWRIRHLKMGMDISRLKLSINANVRRVFMYHIRMCEYLQNKSIDYNRYDEMSDDEFCESLFPKLFKPYKFSFYMSPNDILPNTRIINYSIIAPEYTGLSFAPVYSNMIETYNLHKARLSIDSSYVIRNTKIYDINHRLAREELKRQFMRVYERFMRKPRLIKHK